MVIVAFNQLYLPPPFFAGEPALATQIWGRCNCAAEKIKPDRCGLIICIILGTHIPLAGIILPLFYLQLPGL